MKIFRNIKVGLVAGLLAVCVGVIGAPPQAYADVAGNLTPGGGAAPSNPSSSSPDPIVLGSPHGNYSTSQYYAYLNSGENLSIDQFNLVMIRRGPEVDLNMSNVAVQVKLLGPAGEEHSCKYGTNNVDTATSWFNVPDNSIGIIAQPSSVISCSSTSLSWSSNPSSYIHGRAVQFPASSASGIWKIEFSLVIDPNTIASGVYPPFPSGYNVYYQSMTSANIRWEINANNGSTKIPGRIYTYYHHAASRGQQTFPLWYLRGDGYLYRTQYIKYNGVDSSFTSNAAGITRRDDPNCTPVLKSENEAIWDVPQLKWIDNPVYTASAECNSMFKVFLSPPDNGMPASATILSESPKTELLNTSVGTPRIYDLNYDVPARLLTFRAENYIGSFTLEVDANGDGSFDGPNDRSIFIGFNPDASGLISYQFDGLDGAGNTIDFSRTSVGFRVKADRAGEIHFVNYDVEDREGGIEVTRLTGNGNDKTKIFYDDRDMVYNDASGIDINNYRKCSSKPSPLDALNGIDSTGGVHSWTIENWTPPALSSQPCNQQPFQVTVNSLQAPLNTVATNWTENGTWGDGRWIQDWTYDATADIVSAIYRTPLPGAPNTGRAVVTTSCLGVLALGGSAIYLMRRRRTTS